MLHDQVAYSQCLDTEEGKLPVFADRSIYTASTEHTRFAIAGIFSAADSELGIRIILIIYPPSTTVLEILKKRSEVAGGQYFPLENPDSRYSVIFIAASNQVLCKVLTVKWMLTLLKCKRNNNSFNYQESASVRAVDGSTIFYIREPRRKGLIC